jgi:pimeloyl-ACP methyl ester carboxylesterase
LKVDLLGWLVVGAVLLLGVPATMYLAQDSLLFFPQPLVGPPRVVRPAEPLEFEREEGVKLRGWLVKAAEARAPLVIFYGGNAEELSWQMTEPWPADWSLALVNYRGYGESDGNPSEAALFGDALAVFDVLARRPDVNPARIVLVGRSLGSGIAVYVAAERPVAAVLLISPYDSMTALGQRHYPWLPVGLLLKHPFDSASRAPRIGVPLLAIAGGRDRIIPPAHSRKLVEAWGGPKRFVELGDADHNDLSGAPQFWPAIDGFLREIRE